MAEYLFTNYVVVGPNPVAATYDIFISYEFFYLFWNMFNSKAIRVGYIITIHI